MNKQEFIERMKSLKNIFGNKSEYIKIDAVIELASELDEPQKTIVPQFVADWYEENKDDFEISIFHYVNNINKEDESAFKRWFVDSTTKPFQILVNMHQFGYEVEKEKRFLVKMKGVDPRTNYLYYGEGSKTWLFKTKLIDGLFRKSHTRKQLEEAGFGDVFNSPLFEVEEVEE